MPEANIKFFWWVECFQTQKICHISGLGYLSKAKNCIVKPQASDPRPAIMTILGAPLPFNLPIYSNQ